MAVVSDVIASTAGVTIVPSTPTGSGQQMFTVLINQIKEIDPYGGEVYSIFTQGMNFSLKVIFG